jgi:hypothetical protein
MNRRDLLGEHGETVGGNLAGGTVVVIVSGLGPPRRRARITDEPTIRR